ncbi:alpha/beta hydrolase [Frateuria aurantia]
MCLPTIEQETGPSPTHAIIWLHGLGADGNDFAPIVPELISPAWPALRFVFPHAPVRPVTINGGTPMRAWYDILSFDRDQAPDEAGIRESILALDQLIERENQRGIPSAHIVLAGFSQGGAIVLAAGLRHPQRLAGIVALSTYLPMIGDLEQEASAANAQIPVFWGHGTADPVVQLQWGQQSRARLEALGVPVSWHTYPIGHHVCQPEIHDLQQWLSQRLAD